MPPPPHPQSTPDVARSRSHRGAAGRLGGGTNCWCGTAAAQQPAEGWCPTWAARLGVRRSASSLRVIRRAEALARRGRGHIREHLHGTQAGTPARRLPAGATCTSTWMVATLAQCRVKHCLPRRRGRAVRGHFSILNPNSRFSFHRGLAVWVIPHFLCADYQSKREFIITIPDSYFSLRAPASVQWALELTFKTLKR